MQNETNINASEVNAASRSRAALDAATWNPRVGHTVKFNRQYLDTLPMDLALRMSGKRYRVTALRTIGNCTILVLSNGSTALASDMQKTKAVPVSRPEVAA